MGENADRFLAAFNSIEKGLKDQLNMHRHFSFSRMIDGAKKKHPIVAKYEIDLKKFAELRNVIVHEQTSPDFIIAEPHKEIVALIEKIHKELIEPEKVIPKYKRQVKTFSINDPFSIVLDTIERHAYTQFPIYDHGIFKCLLTNYGITAWLAHHKNQFAFELDKVKLSDVIIYEKHMNNVKFVCKEKSIYDVKELFLHYLDKKITRLEAVLVTENGDPNEPLLGIVTPFDAIRIP
ncbi:CBS domain-containing protein [Alkalihalobacterium alkalinitrilicum]|uniref:CBS domain-containing protein n=1 Tax=Alkalihalobacterium alkalinitrilicum TaxID=427920 RepID=UPI000995B49B|nr:CBS domain-containing protein [Alkalihalobacterium alkalinitrilicum]